MTTASASMIEIGQHLPILTKTVGQRKIDAYSGVQPRSIHSDTEWARHKGFRAPLAQGMMSTAYVSEMMTALLGEGFVEAGEMSVIFIKPVYAGDTLSVNGVVKEKKPEGSAIRVVVDVWCENQEGEKTMVGTASGLAQ